MSESPDPATLATTRERTIMATLDIEIVEATAERVELTMPVTPKVHQPYGLLHGGASVVLAETAASIGSWIAAGPGKLTFGAEINANHLRPVRDGIITAVATPIRQGATIAVWDIRIADEQDRPVCVSRCTIAVRDADHLAPS